MPMALRHGALPEPLAVAQGAVLMSLETLVVYIADRKLRSLPITFKYAGAAAVMLLGATVLLLRGVAGGQASALVPIAWVLSSPPCSVAVLLERATERPSACRHFLPGRC
jgi:hypothetical protein